MHTFMDEKSTGIFSAKEWVQEGDQHLTAARHIRAGWTEKKQVFHQEIEKDDPTQPVWEELVGMPRASILLLGYAAEIHLKAGIAKLYWGCRQEMFRRDIEHLYGHKQLKMARDIAYPDAKKREGDFKLLEHMVLGGARYPTDLEKERKSGIQNPRLQIPNDSSFVRLCELVDSIAAHVARIDGDETDTRHGFSGKDLPIGNDGYWTFRVGGRLRPRLTYRLCDTDPGFDLAAIRSRAEQCLDFTYRTTWDQCEKYEDGERSTIKV